MNRHQIWVGGLVLGALIALSGCEEKPTNAIDQGAAAARDAASQGKSALDGLASKADKAIQQGADALKNIGGADLDKLKGMATEFTTKGKQLAATLTGIKDEATAKAAKADVESAVGNINKYAEQYVSADMMPAFKQLLGDNLGSVTKGLKDQVARLTGDPSISAVLGDTLKGLKLP